MNVQINHNNMYVFCDKIIAFLIKKSAKYEPDSLAIRVPYHYESGKNIMFVLVPFHFYFIVFTRYLLL